MGAAEKNENNIYQIILHNLHKYLKNMKEFQTTSNFLKK